jgi:predicted signal transduction protein with EAL and GGDEF domain
MARSLKLRVVAEGVETLEELEFLRTHQCDEVQGFYFSRPVPPLRFAELLKNGISESKNVPSCSIVPNQRPLQFGGGEASRLPLGSPQV